MMPNIKNIKLENSKNTRHLKHRRVSIPKTNMDRNVNRPFQHEFKNGNFRNDIYFSMDPAVIVWAFIRSVILYAIPAFALHGLMAFIDSFSKAVLGDEYATPPEGIVFLLIVYGICLSFGLRKFSDHMAYYNVSMLVSKYSINQTMLTAIYRTGDIANDKEFAVMDDYRMRFNKYSLFPSVKELAVEEQLYQRDSRSNKEVVKQFAELRRDRLSLSNKHDEHVAAKAIADWKQQQYGGVNEYDVLVKRYQNRTIPAVHEIIKDVQKNY